MLNSKQRAATAFGDGAALVLAGPGAGKTTVIVHRILDLVRRRGIPSEQILVITFTKAAAKEMKERCLSQAEGHLRTTFGTFHSFFFSMLKEELHLKNEDVLDAKTRQFLLKKTAEELRIPTDRLPDFFENIEGEIGYVKNADIRPEEDAAFVPRDLSRAVFARFFARYEAAKEMYGRLDFDDMLLKARELLRSREDILEKWRKRYRYFLVDEAQDMNGVQYELVRLLAAPANNAFFVGDDDQSIYGFRAANPAWMLSFAETFPGGTRIVLDTNYRSAPAVVAASKRLIRHNETRIDKDFAAAQVSAGRITCHACATISEEAEYVTDAIFAEQKEQPQKTIAILFRNHRQSAQVIVALKKRALSYRYAAKQKNPYEHFVYRDAESYFALAAGERRRADVLRVMNRPERFLPRAGLEEEKVSFADWAAYHADASSIGNAIHAFEGQIGRLEKMSSFAAWNYICRGMGYEVFALAQGLPPEADECRQALRKVTELARMHSDKRVFLRELRALRERGRNGETDGEEGQGASAHMGSEGRAVPSRAGSEGSAVPGERDSSSGAVARNGTSAAPKPVPIRLLSFHGSKGLEFDHVYIIDACEGITPSKKAKTKEEVEEERRMFYVAITRAKQELTILTVARRGNEVLYPSRFLKEMAEGGSAEKK